MGGLTKVCKLLISRLARILANDTTGIVRAKLNQSLSRNMATECPA